jgi:DNA-binding transcriptional ArsR family regulator
VQAITDQGTPYMAEETRAALGALEAEHAPQKEGDPTGKWVSSKVAGVPSVAPFSGVAELDAVWSTFANRNASRRASQRNRVASPGYETCLPLHVQTFEDLNMPYRSLVAAKLGRMLGVLSHPHRLRIIEELGLLERDVASLQDALGIRHSGVSQHLAQLRSHGLVAERREGRHVYYRLVQPGLAAWLLDGLRFIEPGPDQAELRAAVRDARASWGAVASTRAKQGG